MTEGWTKEDYLRCGHSESHRMSTAGHGTCPLCLVVRLAASRKTADKMRAELAYAKQLVRAELGCECVGGYPLCVCCRIEQRYIEGDDIPKVPIGGKEG